MARKKVKVESVPSLVHSDVPTVEQARSTVGAEVRFVVMNQLIVIGEDWTDFDHSLVAYASHQVKALVADGSIELSSGE